MSKKMALIIFIIMLIGFCFSTSVLAEAHQIEEVHIRVQVMSDHTYSVWESIRVAFDKPTERFTHTLPLLIQGQRTEVMQLESAQPIAGITNMRQDIIVRFGEKDSVFHGEHLFSVRYLVNAGEPKNDSFFYEVNPTRRGWQSIKSLFFEITMPAPFEPTSIVVYTIENDVIRHIPIELSKTTVRLSISHDQPWTEPLFISFNLPRSYFSDTRPIRDFFSVLTPIAVWIALGFLVLAILLRVLLLRNKKMEYREYDSVPTSLNPMEAALILGLPIDAKQLIAMLMYWANQGKIQIMSALGTDEKEQLVVDEKKILFVRIGSLHEDEPRYRKTLFDMFFADEHDSSPISLLRISRIFKKRAGIIRDETQDYYKQNKEKRLFDQRFEILQEYIRFTAVFPFLYILFKLFYTYTNNAVLAFVLAVTGTFLLMMFASGLESILSFRRGFVKRMLTASAAIRLLLGGFSVLLFSILMWWSDGLYKDEFVFMMLCGIAIHLLSEGIQKRTHYGQQVFNMISGFENSVLFSKNAIEPTVVSIDEDQSFYDALAYAILLDVSDALVDRYNKNDFSMPVWWQDRLFKEKIPKKHLLLVMNRMIRVCKPTGL